MPPSDSLAPCRRAKASPASSSPATRSGAAAHSAIRPHPGSGAGGSFPGPHPRASGGGRYPSSPRLLLLCLSFVQRSPCRPRWRACWHRRSAGRRAPAAPARSFLKRVDGGDPPVAAPAPTVSGPPAAPASASRAAARTPAEGRRPSSAATALATWAAWPPARQALPAAFPRGEVERV